MRAWLSPVRSFMSTLTWLAGGPRAADGGATAAVVLLAARAGLDTHRDTIEVLHMLGSTDLQVARLFQRRIAFDAGIGGVGGGLVALAVWLARHAGRRARLGAAEPRRAGAARLVPVGCCPSRFALLATFAARVAVPRALGRTL